MKFPTGYGPIALLCGLSLVLAACKSGDPSPPAFNQSQSTPSNLEIFTYAGAPATTSYVVFDNATSESITYNPDGLGGTTVDSSGKSGALTIAPPLNQIPGIYYLTVYAQNTNGTSSETVVVNVGPALNAKSSTNTSGVDDVSYTVVNFPMYSNSSPPDNVQRNTDVPFFSARNEFVVGSVFDLLLPVALNGSTNPNGEGVYLNSIMTVESTGTNNSTYAVSADLTVDAALVTQHSGFSTITIDNTDGNGNTTSTTYNNCILLQFEISPSSNGFTLTPYTENICLNLI